MNTKTVKRLRAHLGYHPTDETPRKYAQVRHKKETLILDPKSKRALYQAMKKELR